MHQRLPHHKPTDSRAVDRPRPADALHDPLQDPLTAPAIGPAEVAESPDGGGGSGASHPYDGASFEVSGAWFKSQRLTDGQAANPLGFKLNAHIDDVQHPDEAIDALKADYGADAPLHELPFAMEMTIAIYTAMEGPRAMQVHKAVNGSLVDGKGTSNTGFPEDLDAYLEEPQRVEDLEGY